MRNLVPWPAMMKIVGFTCSTTKKMQEVRQKNGTWEEPTLKQIEGFLHARLDAGDCPRYQGPNPIDIDKTFALYVKLMGKEKARILLHDMFDVQAALAEDKGGHSAEVLAEKLEKIANAHGLETELRRVR